MINIPPTITISKNIFSDINTWLNEHNLDIVVVSILITSKYYILNYHTTIEYKEIIIPIEDIKEIARIKNIKFGNEIINIK